MAPEKRKSNHMNGAEFLIQSLEKQGVEYVFGYPGGTIMPVYDALINAKFTHILPRHEQGGIFAADAYARVSGKPGVCLATSGPGATNLITGIANAYLDSIPLVIITGQVATFAMGTDAFQEVDVLGITLPIVKHSYLPKTAGELPRVINEAFRMAQSGRPGPVLIDLPKDVALSEVPSQGFPFEVEELVSASPADLAKALKLLKSARRPLAYAGGGISLGKAVKGFRKFIERTGLPVVSSLKGLGAVPGNHPGFLGMLGMHGLKAANYAVQSCDLMIVIGSRLDDRATGFLAEFAPEAKLIHMDIDPAEMGKVRSPQVSLIGNLEDSLEALSVRLDIGKWVEECLANKASFAWDYQPPFDGVYAPRLLNNLSKRCGEKTIIACDVGQHQMWVAQHFEVQQPEHHLSSGGLGTMGYGVPAGIGAYLAKPDHNVITVSGDGSIMMNLQEFATLGRYHVPLKILLFDNHRLGMVRQWQDLFFNGRLSQVELNDNPDFVKVAQSFGIPGFRIEHQDQEEDAIKALIQTPGSLLVHAVIDPENNVWPLVPPGKSNAEMMEGVK